MWQRHTLFDGFGFPFDFVFIFYCVHYSYTATVTNCVLCLFGSCHTIHTFIWYLSTKKNKIPNIYGIKNTMFLVHSLSVFTLTRKKGSAFHKWCHEMKFNTKCIENIRHAVRNEAKMRSHLRQIREHNYLMEFRFTSWKNSNWILDNNVTTDYIHENWTLLRETHFRANWINVFDRVVIYVHSKVFL